MLADPHRGELGIHVGQILLDGPAPHAGPDDVEEGKHARLRAVDDLLFELREASPSRAAHVDQRGLSGAEGVAVGLNGAVAVAVL